MGGQKQRVAIVVVLIAHPNQLVNPLLHWIKNEMVELMQS